MSETVDRTSWLWCHSCRSPQPPEGRVGFRCAKCHAKAASMPRTYIEPAEKPRLYDNAGNLIKQPKKKKARVAAPASVTTKEQSK